MPGMLAPRTFKGEELIFLWLAPAALLGYKPQAKFTTLLRLVHRGYFKKEQKRPLADLLAKLYMDQDVSQRLLLRGDQQDHQRSREQFEVRSHYNAVMHRLGHHSPWFSADTVRRIEQPDIMPWEPMLLRVMNRIETGKMSQEIDPLFDAGTLLGFAAQILPSRLGRGSYDRQLRRAARVANWRVI